MNILVLQPTRPTNPPALRLIAQQLLARLPDANPGMSFEMHADVCDIEIYVSPSKYTAHATARNWMLDQYLTEQHDYVFWVDSDLIDYPADLPMRLHATNPGGITAPLVLLDASPARLRYDADPERFYDIGGFIERGIRAGLWQPWFNQSGELIDLDSVGCIYLAPAALYRDGVRYAPAETDYYVEHYSVCQAAKARGYRVCALTTARAIHAWLPDYGLPVNT